MAQDITDERLVTNISNAPIKGDKSARAVLIEYSDFECPFCKRHAEQTFDRIDRELIAAGTVRYAFRHFPLEKIHPHAAAAAHAADCAAAQGRFWEMRTHLYNHQSELKDAVWLRNAGKLGLNESELTSCLSVAASDKRAADQAEARRLGVTSTPTFLIGLVDVDGSVRVHRKIEGAHPFEVFRDAVNEVLADQ